jgi:hypothetical protein
MIIDIKAGAAAASSLAKVQIRAAGVISFHKAGARTLVQTPTLVRHYLKQ